MNNNNNNSNNHNHNHNNDNDDDNNNRAQDTDGAEPVLETKSLALAFPGFLTSQTHVSSLAPSSMRAANMPRADTVVAESKHALLDEWAGFAFEVDSSFQRYIAEGKLPLGHFIKAPGTSWEIQARGIQGHVHDGNEHPALTLPLCLFTTRWCPMHPEVSRQLVWEKNSLLERNMTKHQQQALCLARAETHWRWCGEVAQAPLSMIFMHDSLSNASWSTYPEDGGEGTRQKLVGSYGKESNGWRQLYAWVQDQELVVAPPGVVPSPAGVAPQEEDLVRALLNWQALVPDALQRGAFSVEAAEAVVAHVYRQEQAKWWASMGAASLPAAWHAEILQDWWVVTLLDGMTGGFFVDLAAYDAVAFSNSYVLERDYGWGGICVEPQSKHWKGLLHRKCVAVAAVVGHATGTAVEFDTRNEEGVAGIASDDHPNKGAASPVSTGDNGDAGESHWGSDAPKRVTFRTVTVRKILQDFKAPPVIHYLSLDVEGSEFLVLQTFPFDAHRVLVITIEKPDLCVRTILRQEGYLYLRDLAGQDEVWVHPTLPQLARKLEKYGKREPRRDDFLPKSKDTAHKCREMARSLAQGLLRGCCRPDLALPEQGGAGAGGRSIDVYSNDVGV
jgi:hypothetical protein